VKTSKVMEFSKNCISTFFVLHNLYRMTQHSYVTTNSMIRPLLDVTKYSRWVHESLNLQRHVYIAVHVR